MAALFHITSFFMMLLVVFCCCYTTTAARSQRVAVVTGGGRGIGAACCKVLAREGYHVIVNYKSDSKAAEEVASNIRNNGGCVDCVAADVSNQEGVDHLFEEADKAGTLVALVNNAGIIGPSSRVKVEELTVSQLREIMATNVEAPLMCIQAAIKRMSKKNGGNGGAIINISSGAAYIGSPVLYSMSKAALNSLQIGLISQLAEAGIRINTVSPGITKTDLISKAAIEATAKSIPMGRPGQPHEIAETVAFLLDEAKSSYTTGANVRISGGRPPGTTLG
jgi:NAD(P)-dependent dehydrogenase (short-subunit alcohol dehydrogenase family)